MGFTLEEIKDVFSSSIPKSKSERINVSKKILKIQLEEIDNKINDLKHLKERTQRAIALLDKCNYCKKGNCSEDCPNKKNEFLVL